MSITNRFFVLNGSFYFDTLDSSAVPLIGIQDLNAPGGHIIDWAGRRSCEPYTPSSWDVMTLIDALKFHQDATIYPVQYRGAITALEDYLMGVPQC